MFKTSKMTETSKTSQNKFYNNVHGISLLTFNQTYFFTVLHVLTILNVLTVLSVLNVF
jgi:hypothetical protein